jgi:hypothetical protein
MKNREVKKELKKKRLYFSTINYILFHKDENGGCTWFFATDELPSKLEAIKTYNDVVHIVRNKIKHSIKNEIYGVKKPRLLQYLMLVLHLKQRNT